MIRLGIFSIWVAITLASAWYIGRQAFQLILASPTGLLAPLQSSTWAPPGGAVHAKIDVERLPLALYPLTTTNPVFFEGRQYPIREVPKPFPVVTAAVARPPPLPTMMPTPPVPPQPLRPVLNPEKLKLRGVMSRAGNSQALIELQGQAPTWYRVGDKIQEWAVDGIDTSSISLRQGGQTATLELYNVPDRNKPHDYPQINR
jgi:hypothetical protein